MQKDSERVKVVFTSFCNVNAQSENQAIKDFLIVEHRCSGWQ